MKKKVIKFKGITGDIITLTVDENLNKLKGKVLAPKRLEEANRILRNLKCPLPL